MKRTAVLSSVILLLFLLSASALGYTQTQHTVYENRIAVSADDGVYLIGYSGNDWRIEKAAPDTTVRELSLSYPIASVALWGDTAAALCDDFANDQMILYTYEIDTELLDSMAIPAVSGYHRGFYRDDSSVLIQDDDRPSVIYRYSFGGRMIDSFDLNASNASMFCDNEGNLYILADETLYRYENGRYRMIGSALSAPIGLIDDDTMIDSSGTVYRLFDDHILELMRSDHIDIYTAAAVSGQAMYISAYGTVYRYDLSTGIVTDYFTADAPICALYCEHGALYAVTDDMPSRVLCIFPDEFIPYSSGGEPDPVDPITGDAYRIDADKMRITRIPAQTTLAQLKSNLNYGANQIQLYSGDKLIKSGYVGTAMTLKLSGTDVYAYELSVIGDITGEGNANSRDLNDLMDYFLGNITFNGVYTIAADLNDDGQVDMRDLALLCRGLHK